MEIWAHLSEQNVASLKTQLRTRHIIDASPFCKRGGTSRNVFKANKRGVLADIGRQHTVANFVTPFT
jgi:hypothetical protein